jgi:3-deoxy-D-manno-octulosonate 8-phosphate phosphatase KdsC-like HAD superfamily phosphatase
VIPCIGEIGVWILEIDPNRTAEIGDTMGDRFIADRVSWFGCPANAEAEIKKSAA